MSLFGFALMLVQIGYSYRAYQFQEEALSMLAKGIDIPELPESWGKGLPPEKRTTDSTELARAAFLDDGRIQHIFGLSGARQLFVPTAKDMQDREDRVARFAKLEESAESTSLLSTRLTITTVLVPLFGFGFGRRKGS